MKEMEKSQLDISEDKEKNRVAYYKNLEQRPKKQLHQS